MSTLCMNNFRRPSIQYETNKNNNNNNNDNENYNTENTIRLQLKKPKNWNWELTTSKSSPNIAFPRVLLYDNKGKLLADARESDCVFKSTDDVRDSETTVIASDPVKRAESLTISSSKNKKKRRLSASSLKQLQNSLSDFIDRLSENGIECKVNHPSRESSESKNITRSTSSLITIGRSEDSTIRSVQTPDLISDDIPLDTKETIPISVYSERGLLQRDFNAKEFDHLRPKNKIKKNYEDQNLSLSLNNISRSNEKYLSPSPRSDSITPNKEVRFNLQKSQSVFDVQYFGEREKRKCRRSKSTEPSKFSGSILERMRAFKERSSSSEEQDLQISYVNHGPRYFLRTCRAGTLVVCEESFHHKKIRRRPVSIPRISEAEETDSKTVPEIFIQNHKSTDTNSQFINKNKKLENLNDNNSLDIQNINGGISEMSLNGKFYKNNDSKKFSSSKNLEFINNTEYNNNYDEIKVKKRKKFKKLRRCVSAGTVYLSTSSSDDDDCSQASNKSSSFRQKRKISSSARNKKEKGDQILTLNNSNNNNNNNSNNSSLSTSTSATVVQQTVGPSSDIIDEKTGTDEVLVEFVRHLTSLQEQKQNKKIFDKNENYLSSSHQDKESSSSSSSSTSLLSIKKSQDKNFNANHTKLGHCQQYQQSIENFIKDSFNNNNNNNLKVNSVDKISTLKINKKLNFKDVIQQKEYAKICDNNNNSSDKEYENDNDDENDNNVNKQFLDNDFDDENIKEYVNYDNDNNDNYIESDDICELSETTTTTTTNCSDSETFTVLNFNQNLNKNLKYNNKNKKIFANDKINLLDYNYNNNMGSNVSRNSGKGLSGRRTQSSGNLYSEKHGNVCTYPSNLNPNDKLNSTLPPGTVGVINGKACKKEMPPEYNNSTSKTCHTELIIQPLDNTVTKKDRNKFCGSLPNHLDAEDESSEGIQNLDRIDTTTIILNEHNQQENYLPVAPPRRQHLQHQKQQQQQQLNLSSNTLSSGIESTITQPGSDSFRINQVRPDIQLKLPLVRSNPDPSCDQGYGSERSPEDELPPPMPELSSTSFPLLQNYNMDWDYSKCNNNPYCYSFITKDCTFSLQITKGSRGLGLSISGGIDSNAAFPGLIRIKRLFPHQPAWATGKLQPGDIILEVNEVPLTGLTNYEALEVLRTMPNEIVLLICRPSDEEYKKLSPPAEPPKPPSRTTQQQGTQTFPEDYPLEPLAPLQTNFTGEFEIIMVKQQGSLGFTLRKEDESVLGHYVRALVREPATTDGRIKPGDKIVAVNDVPLSPMTHEQAVIFLRQAADAVKLRLYRDEAQTPVAAMSPTMENKTFCNTGKKTLLRPEAINLLSDLAQKKQTTPGDSTESSLISNNASPRRLRRANKQNSGNTSQSEHDTSDSRSSSNHQYIVSSQSASLCSDSEQSVTSQCSYRAPQSINPIDDELFKMETNGERPDRPSFLDLAGQSGSTPVVSRKPRFQFTIAANAHELNNFENQSVCNDHCDEYSENSDGLLPKNNSQSHPNCSHHHQHQQHEFTSLPCETFLIACKTESDLKDEANFSYKNPMYQSAQLVQTSQGDDVPPEATKKEGNSSLLKWKGVVLSPDSEEEKKLESTESDNGIAGEGESGDGDEDTSYTTTTPGSDSTVKAQKSFNTKKTFPTSTTTSIETPSSSSSSHIEGYKIISVELNRGWNSRLGFSLQFDPNTRTTVISAIYSDSVAAKDGRLRVGDQILTVNDESVEDMPTSEIIDLLRILRGSIVINVLRKNSS